MQDVPVALDCLVPPFSQPTGAEDAIFEVLRYSQKDMDAALDKVRNEVESAASREVGLTLPARASPLLGSQSHPLCCLYRLRNERMNGMQSI